jgi:hypothetical protein
VSRLPTRRNDSSRPQAWRNQAQRAGGSAVSPTNAPPSDAQATSGDAEPSAVASRVTAEGRRRAENLRHDGLSRARSIIANAEREAQAVIQAAKQAAEAAEAQARARAEAILAGKPLPPEVDAPPVIAAGPGSQDAPAAIARVSPLPPEGATLRYRIALPMSFAAMLRLKRDVARFPGVSSVNMSPGRNGEAVLSLQAPDAEDVLSRLRAIPRLAESRP